MDEGESGDVWAMRPDLPLIKRVSEAGMLTRHLEHSARYKAPNKARRTCANGRRDDLCHATLS